MRVETIHGRYLLCGGVIPAEDVEVGQIWSPADGSNRSVRVEAVTRDFVTYSWKEGDSFKEHSKLNFAFQCRYCLVLPTNEVPRKYQVT